VDNSKLIIKECEMLCDLNIQCKARDYNSALRKIFAVHSGGTIFAGRYPCQILCLQSKFSKVTYKNKIASVCALNAIGSQ
jgi:hypothetical protein